MLLVFSVCLDGLGAVLGATHSMCAPAVSGGRASDACQGRIGMRQWSASQKDRTNVYKRITLSASAKLQLECV